MEGGKVYWQKQGMDSLCGVHCINSLLQGPFFDEVTLSQFALELDRKERELMLEQGMTKDFLKYMSEDSGNVAMDGNYSVQVLQEALATLGLKMLALETLKGDLVSKQGFICNSSAHWFALRRVAGTWYNLNSFNRRMPEVISDFYLSAFLEAVRTGGYQIFSVEGAFPESSPDRFDHYNPHQLWFDSRRIAKYHEKCIKRKGYRPNIGDGRGDKHMEKAIAQSLGQKYQEYISSGEDSDWDQPPKPKDFAGTAASLAEHVEVPYQNFAISQNDPELLELIKQSLAERFQVQPSAGLLVVLRYPNGRKDQRLFGGEDDVEAVYDYVWHSRAGNKRFYLTNFESRQKLTDLSIPLLALADENNTAILIVNEH